MRLKISSLGVRVLKVRGCWRENRCLAGFGSETAFVLWDIRTQTALLSLFLSLCGHGRSVRATRQSMSWQIQPQTQHAAEETDSEANTPPVISVCVLQSEILFSQVTHLLLLQLTGCSRPRVRFPGRKQTQSQVWIKCQVCVRKGIGSKNKCKNNYADWTISRTRNSRKNNKSSNCECWEPEQTFFEDSDDQESLHKAVLFWPTEVHIRWEICCKSVTLI